MAWDGAAAGFQGQVGLRFSGVFRGSFNPKALANLRACALHKARTRSCFVWFLRLRKNS